MHAQKLKLGRSQASAEGLLNPLYFALCALFDLAQPPRPFVSLSISHFLLRLNCKGMLGLSGTYHIVSSELRPVLCQFRCSFNALKGWRVSS